jgi:hypothetical protein
MLDSLGECSIPLGGLTIGISHPREYQQFHLTRSLRLWIQVDIEHAASLGPVRTGQVFRNASAARQAT